MGLFLSQGHHTPAILRMPTFLSWIYGKKMNLFEELAP